jgi:hypothetical protein
VTTQIGEEFEQNLLVGYIETSAVTKQGIPILNEEVVKEATKLETPREGFSEVIEV